MSTILVVCLYMRVERWLLGRIEELTSLLSWVSKTATPASTLPTVSEISIVGLGRVGILGGF